MLIQIAILAWIFLGETLGPLQIAGLAIAAFGAILVHVTPRRVIEARVVPEEV
jgi:drug/metabolite transporter (DMT)-like permease